MKTIQITVENQAGPVKLLNVTNPPITVNGGIKDKIEDRPGPRARPKALAATNAAQYFVRACKNTKSAINRLKTALAPPIPNRNLIILQHLPASK